MSVRKMLLVCILVAAAVLPLVGCKDKAAKPAGGAPAPRSTNTTD